MLIDGIFRFMVFNPDSLPFIRSSARRRASSSSWFISSTYANSGFPRSSPSIASTPLDRVHDAEVGRRSSRKDDGLFVRCIEHRRMLLPTRVATGGPMHGRERLIVQWFKRPSCGLRPVARRGDIGHTIRRRQGKAIGSRMSGRRSLANRRSVHKFDHRMDDGLRVHGHDDAIRRHVEQTGRLDDFESFFISVDELMVTTGPICHVG